MRSRAGWLTILEIVLVVALSCVSIRAFSASFAYDHLANWVSGVSGISSTELFLILSSLLSLIGAFVALRGWKGGITLFALMLFMVCSPSILAFSQKKWFAFSGGKPSWDTSLTLAEMLAEGVLIILGCLVLYYISWFREMKNDLLDRGSEQTEADQAYIESHRFFYEVLLVIITTIILTATMAYGLRYALRGLINDVPIVVLLVGLGSCLTIMGVLYFYLRRAGVRPIDEASTIKFEWVNDIPDFGGEREAYPKKETQSLKIEDQKLADQSPAPNIVLNEVAEQYYSKFNKIGWVKWIEWLDDSFNEKVKGEITIEKSETIVFCKSFGFWSAPSIMRWQSPDFKKRERLYLSSLVATDRRLIIRYGPTRKKTFLIIIYKDITGINETSSGSLSISTKNERIDFIDVEKEAEETISDFIVAVCRLS